MQKVRVIYVKDQRAWLYAEQFKGQMQTVKGIYVENKRDICRRIKACTQRVRRIDVEGSQKQMQRVTGINVEGIEVEGLEGHMQNVRGEDVEWSEG